MSAAKTTYVFIQPGSGGAFYRVHRAGCKDIAKEIRNSADPSRSIREWPTVTAASAEDAVRAASEDVYDDPSTLNIRDVEFLNCTKVKR